MELKHYKIDPSMRRPRRPLKAWRHFRNLMANKEDTSQVFYIVEALNGDSFQKHFVKFANSELGRKRMEQRRYLPPILDDHKSLAAMPARSLGRAYLDFMTREGLTAQGLVDEYDASNINRDYGNADLNWFGDRMRDTHDMQHVLTGFGRDALGEASVLGMTHALHGGPGILFIAYGAAMEVRKGAPKGTPCLKSINEARKIGKAAQDIAYHDIVELLPQPLEDVRALLNITLPTQYHRAHDMMRANGIDPYQMVAAA